MLKKLIRFFHFTRAERRGSALLLALIVLLSATPALLRWAYPPRQTDFTALRNELALLPELATPSDAAPELFPFDPNTATLEDFRRLGLSEKLGRTILRYRERGGRYRRAEDFGKMYGLSVDEFERLKPYLRFTEGEKHTDRPPMAAFEATSAEPFPFNPNVASRAELVQLGIPTYVAERMIKYREKGGIFRKPDDVQKMYGFSPALYAKLAPYITLPSAETPSAKATMVHYRVEKRPPAPVQINVATAEDWQTLPGIGAGRAAAIVAYRDRLGGFVAVDQLREVRALPDSVLQAIRPLLTCRPENPKRIAVNAADEATLRRHPYFSIRQAKALVAYRDQHGPFRSLAELSAVIALRDAAWLARIEPYLSFE